MKKYLIIISMMLFLVPGLVYALPWALDDVLQQPIIYSNSVNGGVGGSGGVFKIVNTTKGETIYTFCVELNEYTNYATKVLDTSDDIATWGGRNTNTGDMLSGSTKWLFSRYLVGDTAYNNYKAMALAIWYLEDEYYDKGTLDQWVTWYTSIGGSTLAQKAREYIVAAQQRADYVNPNILALDTYNGSGGIGGTQGQSYLYAVPEPSILILLGIALSAVGLASRRYKF